MTFFYINHCSFKLDFMILKLTFQQILKGDSYLMWWNFWWSFKNGALSTVCDNFVSSLKHRGPDGHVYFTDTQNNLF